MKPTNTEQLNIFDDLSPHKLHRKNDPETSKEAAYSLNISKRRAFVLNLVEEAGVKGTTTKEMTKQFPDVPHSSITSRPNELEKLNLIFYAGDKRNGSRVIRHVKYKTNSLLETINMKPIKTKDPSRLGDIAEHYAITWLWDQGFDVFNNSGCTGPVDMIALDREGDMLLIDVKTEKGWNTGYRSPLQKQLGVKILCFNPKERKLRFVEHKT